MQERKELLETIFNLKNPDDLPLLGDRLRKLGWDSPEGEVANLTREHIIHLLQRYLEQALSEQQVEDWANLVEVREDITFGKSDDEDVIMDVIHDLANPALEGVLTPDRAQKMIADLQG